MAETFETLKAKIRDWLGVDTTRLPDSVCGDCINLVQQRVMRKHDLRFGETADTMAVATNDFDYDLPVGWQSPLDFWYINPTTGSYVQLRRLPKDEFDSTYPDSTKTGTVAHYTVWGNTLYLGPTPERAITLNRNYYKSLPDLADGPPNNTNLFIEQAWDVLFFGALEEATKYGIEDARVAIWAVRFQELELDLVSSHHREKSVGRVAQSEEPG